MKRVGNSDECYAFERAGILIVLLFVAFFQFASADKMRENVSVSLTEKTKDLNNYLYVVKHG